MNTIEISEQQKVRPWVRYWARMIDIIIFSVLSTLFFAIFFGSITFLDIAFDKYSYLLAPVLLFLYIFFEALLLSTWGTTLGKALFRVKVRNKDESKLSYLQALKRTFLVTVKGQGLGIPIVSLITHVVAYQGLTNEYETSWDRDGEHKVTHQKIGFIRIGIFLIPLLFILVSILSPTIAIDYKLSESAKRANAKLPRMIDPLTQAESVSYANQIYTRYFSILDSNVTKNQINRLAPILKQGNCKDPSTHYFVKRGVRFDFVYAYNDGVDSVVIRIDDCEKLEGK